MKQMGGRVVFGKADRPGIPDWLLSLESFSGSCVVQSSCIVSTRQPGFCTIRVDPAQAKSVFSTSLSAKGKDQLTFNKNTYQHFSGLPYHMMPTSDISWWSSDPSSVFTLCWGTTASKVSRKSGSLFGKPSGKREATGLASKCMWVNGLCWLWAAPCSGSCASVALGDQHPGVLRYASATEWAAAFPSLNASRVEFHDKCAAAMLISPHDHCDGTDLYSRHGPENEPSSDELVLIYEINAGDTAIQSVGGPPGGGGDTVQATGDPHLINKFGQRFDLYREGHHTLLHIPRWSGQRKTLLRVDAEARKVPEEGGSCSDVYFTAINITGRWAEEHIQRDLDHHHRTLEYLATKPPADKKSVTKHYNKMQIKIVWGHTHDGVQYLNLIMKHLNRINRKVGGLLGEDDHTLVATPKPNCRRTISL